MDQGLKDYSLFDILEKRAINVNDCTLYRTIFNAKFKEKEIVFKSITCEKERLIKDNEKIIINEYHLMRKLNDLNIKGILKIFPCFYFTKEMSAVFYGCGFGLEKMPKTLQHIKDKKTNLNELDLIWILYEMLRILKDLQLNDFCHRDIKLENIFLDYNNSIRLGDFGEGKKLECVNLKIEKLKEVNLNSIRGTFPYMAPEIIELYHIANDKMYDNLIEKYNPYKTDLYSLGLCIMNLIYKDMRIFSYENMFFNKIDEKTYKEKVEKDVEDCSNRVECIKISSINF